MIYSLDTISRDKLTSLSAKCIREYNSWYAHVRNKIEEKKTVLEKLLPKVNEWELKVHLLWKNHNLENSIFIPDELSVDVVSEDWVLADECNNNTKKVFKYYYEKQEMFEHREDIVNYNGLYWLWALAVLEFDEDEQLPQTTCIDPLSIIPDPLNWRWSKMRFIWVNRKVFLDSIKENPSYKTDDLYTVTSAEMERLRQARDSALWYACVVDNEWMIDLYDHFTIFEWHKYLITFAWDRTKIIRLIEIEPLTDSEKKNPTKVKYPITLFRRKPIVWSFYGASIADEVLQEQDVMSLLLNLMTIQANIQALWSDKYFDAWLWIDTNKLATLWMPWGRMIPVTPNPQRAIESSFYQDNHSTSQNFPLQMLDVVKSFSNETMSRWEIAFWQSANWSQTKAEVNTLMENINQQLGYISQNYMRAEKNFWSSIYHSFSINMSPNAYLTIVLYESGKALNKRLKKSDFIVEWKYQIYITSKTQQKIQDEKDFNKLIALQWVILPNITDQSGKNNFMRFLSKKMSIDWFNPLDFVIETPDEIKAKENVELLNNDIEVDWPQVGQDLRTYRSIYAQALDTNAKRKVILQYDIAIMNEPKQETVWVADKMGQWIAMNNLNQKQNNNPSLSNVWT